MQQSGLRGTCATRLGKDIVMRNCIRGLCLAWLLSLPLTVIAATPMVTTGEQFALALKSDGTIVSWGLNAYGQLGNGQGALRPSPGRVEGIDQVTAVAAGTAFTLALRANRTVWAWGTNLFGQLGNGTKRSSSHPVQVKGIGGTVTSIAAGDKFALAVTSDNKVWAWGAGGSGALATGDRNSRAHAVEVSGLPAVGVSTVAAGSVHALALAKDGTLWAWGDNTSGQLGTGTTVDSLIPVQVSALSSIVAISAHQRVNLALDSSDRVWAWGRGIRGSLGDGTTDDHTTPFIVPGLPPIKEIRAGQVISMAVARAGGAVWAWGHNEFGQFGDSSYAVERSPTLVSNLNGLSRFEMGNVHVLARDSGGTVLAWGRNDRGQLGVGDANDRAAPTPIQGVGSIVQAAAGEAHSVAVDGDGSVWAWGAAGSGELGDNAVAISNIPVDVSGATNMVSVAAGVIHSLALDANGSVWGWGANDSYQLGDTTRRDSLVPIPLTGLPAIDAIAAGNDSSFALDHDGNLWSWGSNGASGRLGRGVVSGVQLPGKLTALSGVKAIAVTNQHALAIGSDNSVWSWGTNRYGALGDGTTEDRSMPVQVLGLADIVAVAAGAFHSLALGSGGEVWAWGYNARGQLGDGTQIDSHAPVKVSGLAKVVAISAGGHNSCALSSDGRLWTWGHDISGQLGNGLPRSSSSIAAPIPSLESFQSFSCDDRFSVAMRDDGTVWAWGRNFEGQIGDGTFAWRPEPVLAINPSANGPLDLLPGEANSIPADKTPPFLVKASRQGDLTDISLSVDVRGTSGAGAFASDVGRFAADYNVYVAASVPVGDASLYLQLDSGHNWSELHWPMAEFMRSVSLNSQSDVVSAQILQNIDLSSPDLAGASVLVGYGTEPDEMLGSARYRVIFTVPEP